MSLLIQQKLSEKLNNTGAISFKEICEILDAFQIASGQGFAIGKTKAILEYIKKGNNLIIQNYEYSNNQKIIYSINELINIYKNIDQFIDLSTDKDFKNYFQ